MSMVSFGKSACVIAAVVLIYCCFEQEAFAQSGKNEAIFNKDKKPNSTKHWVWRDKKAVPSSNGVDGIIAVMKSLGPPNHEAEMKIWLYKEGQSTTTASGRKLALKETYTVYLTDNEQVNSEKKTNKSFHYMVTTPITGANGQQDPSGGTRTFLITGTRERGNSNKSRTLRVTTFTTKPPLPPEPEPEPLPEDSELSTKQAVFRTLIPCTDYPDDAVLDEDEQILTVVSGVYQPYPEDDWMSVWP